MESIFEIKSQIAKLAFQGKRLDEAERIFQEIIFDPNSTKTDKGNAWSAIGAIKSSKFRENNATFDEIAFSFSQSRNNGNADADALYGSEIISILLEYSALVKELKKIEVELKNTKMAKAILGGISLAIGNNISWKSSPFLKAGILGFGVTQAADYYSDRLTEDKIPSAIEEVSSKFQFVLLNYNQIYNFENIDILSEIINQIENNPNVNDYNNPVEKLKSQVNQEKGFEAIITEVDEIKIQLFNYHNKHFWGHLNELKPDYLKFEDIVCAICSYQKHRIDLVLTTSHIYLDKPVNLNPFKKIDYEKRKIPITNWDFSYSISGVLYNMVSIPTIEDKFMLMGDTDYFMSKIVEILSYVRK